MLKQFAAMAGIALAVAGCAIGFSPSTASLYRNSTVEVKDGKGEGHGSGVVIGESSVLTALHVVKNQDTVRVIFNNDEVVEGKPVWKNEKLDIAVVSVKAPESAEVVDINCSQLAWGQPLTVVGFPMHDKYVANQGHVGSIDMFNDSKNGSPYLVPVDMTVVPGQSGGPVFNENGELVGIADAVMLFPFSMMSVSLTGNGYIVPSSLFCGVLPK